jgi:hypothetical protein
MEEEIQDILFDSIVIKNNDEYNNLIDNLTIEQSYLMLIQSVQYAYKNGVFSMAESELISKAIRMIQK